MEKFYGLIFDLERCIGWETYTIACQIENGFISDIIQVKTLNTLDKDTPSDSFIQGNLRMEFQPCTCNHCEDAPCVKVCNFDALTKREDVIVVLNCELCIGCQVCISECPYGAIRFNEMLNMAEKYNLCSHRVNQGLKPFCVLCCERQAIYFGDSNAPEGKLTTEPRVQELYVSNPEFNTNSKVKYLPLKKTLGL